MKYFQKSSIGLFLVLVPVFKLINLFMTYTELVFNTNLVIAFFIDVCQGYVTWLAVHFVIVRIESQHSDAKFSKLRFAKLLFFTYLVAIITVIIVPDGSNLITGKRFAAPKDGFYVHDLVIFFVWILIINFIYILLRYYETWKKSEEKLEGERTLKAEGLAIKIGGKDIKLQLRDIRGFFVEDGFTYVIDSDFKTNIVDSSLDNLEQKLPERYFFRVNRKFILHRSSIVSFKRIEDNKLLIATLAEKPLPDALPMSRLKALAFKKWFEQDTTQL